MDVFERLGLGRLIDSSLGKRDASWNAFRYSEVIETLFCDILSHGDAETSNCLSAVSIYLLLLLKNNASLVHFVQWGIPKG